LTVLAIPRVRLLARQLPNVILDDLLYDLHPRGSGQLLDVALRRRQHLRDR
jgi:hypothetical protein